ncbi:MAG: NAD-dependent epimerase/dehydratase family protein [Actinobacteria bacterium]|nr:NAD-dependent epimerase/dehydratase family protein [Actinomycetota bacterium]
MRVYVTGGGLGFIGGHVVRVLRERGIEVADEYVDVLDGPGLERAMRGCDAVLHVAALYSYEPGDGAAPARVNIEGTKTVLAAASRAGIGRVVHTSSAGTCGPVAGRPATEDDAPPEWELAVPYKRTKLEAELLALAAGAIVVNPTTPVGEGDERPTPTGAMIRGVASGRFHGFIASTGLNVVDVHDVAVGHALALERGRPGERYLLGGVDMGLGDFFALVARAAGRRPPPLRVPYAAARAAAALRLVNANEVALARLPMFFSSGKAERELGYRRSPIEPAIARAVAAAMGSPTRSARRAREGAGLPG